MNSLLTETPPQALATLGRHNLLLPLVRAEVIKAAVESAEISSEEQDELLAATAHSVT